MNIREMFLMSYKRVRLLIFDVISLIVLGVLCFGASYLFKNGFVFSNLVFRYGLAMAFTLGSIIVSRLLWGIYSNIWRYTSTLAYFKLVLADMCGGVVATVLTFIFNRGFKLDICIAFAALSALMSLSARFSYRLIYKKLNQNHPSAKDLINVAIVGAGQLGAFLASELKTNINSDYNPVFYLDKDKNKVGGTVMGLRVYDEDNARSVLEKYDINTVIIAVGDISNEEAHRIHKNYTSLGCRIKIYAPSVIDNQNSGEDKKRVIREFEIEDLLFRNPLSLNCKKDFEFYKDKVIMVTGGGGSIGSELCRQIAKCQPKKLIILDIYENNAYDIQQELIRKYGSSLDLSVEIASVRDRKRLEGIFANYRPQLVFHAAAHKHVPFMEHSAVEAIKNNVMGTFNTADMAEKYGVQKFVLISTDKAVNPTNVMGASKRMCEMIIQCRVDSKTTFSAVRFGNVLGSNGSVIPLFKRQIAQGGPVTITDFRIIRYFMTIPEASQLVMQAGALAQKGELFVLDMGKPIKIYDLAVNMIKLSGFVPGKDIEIKEIGLRPGEKLYEELLIKTEELTKTENNMIFIEKDAPLTRAEVDEKISILNAAVAEAESQPGSDLVKKAVMKVIPTFHCPEELNDHAEDSQEMLDAGVVVAH